MLVASSIIIITALKTGLIGQLKSWDRVRLARCVERHFAKIDKLNRDLSELAA
jgi:hypothetical protein